MHLLKLPGWLWTGRYRTRSGLACEVGRDGAPDEGHPPNTHGSCTHPHHRLFDVAEDKPGLSPRETLHTHLQLQAVPSTLSGAGPVPRSQPRVLGGSEGGREAPRASFSICLFISPVYTFQALITPGAQEEGHAACGLGL